MEAVNYLKDSNGIITGLFINPEDKKKLSEEIIEDRGQFPTNSEKTVKKYL